MSTLVMSRLVTMRARISCCVTTCDNDVMPNPKTSCQERITIYLGVNYGLLMSSQRTKSTTRK